MKLLVELMEGRRRRKLAARLEWCNEILKKNLDSMRAAGEKETYRATVMQELDAIAKELRSGK